MTADQDIERIAARNVIASVPYEISPLDVSLLLKEIERLNAIQRDFHNLDDVAEIRRLREMLNVAHSALLSFVTTYNGKPIRFREAEKVSGDDLTAAYDKLDAFLYPASAVDVGG